MAKRFKKGSTQAKRYMARLRSKRKINKVRSPVISMARKRRFAKARSSFRSYAKRRSFGKTEIVGLAIGAGLYTAYKIFLAPQLQKAVPQIANMMPIVETAGGYLLAKGKNAYVRDAGKVMFTFGVFQLINQYLVPAISPSMSVSNGGAY